MPSTVTVHYPCHPLANHCLKVIVWPRRLTTAVTVQHPDGSAVKVPLWMVRPEAAGFRLGEQAVLSSEALIAVVDLLAVHSSSTVAKNPHREPTHEADRVATRRPDRPWHHCVGGGARTTAHRADGPSARRRSATRPRRAKGCKRAYSKPAPIKHLYISSLIYLRKRNRDVLGA